MDELKDSVFVWVKFAGQFACSGYFNLLWEIVTKIYFFQTSTVCWKGY